MAKRGKLQIYEDLGEDKQIAQQLFLLASEGMLPKDIRKKLKISVSLWQIMLNKREEFPIYMDMYDKGVILGSEKVIEALKNRALGYDYIEKQDDDLRGTKTIHKHVPADVNAIKYYLGNVNPKNWQEKRVVESTVITKTDEIDYSKMSPRALKELLIASGRMNALPAEIVEVKDDEQK